VTGDWRIMLQNASLNLYFMAVVKYKYGKSEDYIRTKMEPIPPWYTVYPS